LSRHNETGATTGAFTTISPMLATLARDLPDGDQDWAYEFKWDGVRAMVFVDETTLRIQGRRQDDISHRYPELAGLADTRPPRQVVLDGEIVALDANGRPSFQLLQQRMHVTNPSDARGRAKEVPATFLAFDVLVLDGRSVMDRPYRERRKLLEDLKVAGPFWQTTPSQIGGGAVMVEASQRSGIEGIVAKRLDGLYEPGRRSRCWLKLKNHLRQEFLIAGWTLGDKARTTSFGALLLGYYDEAGQVRYAGNVGTGFTEQALKDLTAVLSPLRRPTSPFAEELPRAVAARAVFVQPTVVADVEFGDWTTEGRLRHPSFKGVRSDKDPREVVREENRG